jgi:hypothetical protein
MESKSEVDLRALVVSRVSYWFTKGVGAENFKKDVLILRRMIAGTKALFVSTF